MFLSAFINVARSRCRVAEVIHVQRCARQRGWCLRAGAFFTIGAHGNVDGLGSYCLAGQIFFLHSKTTDFIRGIAMDFERFSMDNWERIHTGPSETSLSLCVPAFKGCILIYGSYLHWIFPGLSSFFDGCCCLGKSRSLPGILKAPFVVACLITHPSTMHLYLHLVSSPAGILYIFPRFCVSSGNPIPSGLFTAYRGNYCILMQIQRERVDSLWQSSPESRCCWLGDPIQGFGGKKDRHPKASSPGSQLAWC